VKAGGKNEMPGQQGARIPEFPKDLIVGHAGSSSAIEKNRKPVFLVYLPIFGERVAPPI
jgi:hypothetical protein